MYFIKKIFFQRIFNKYIRKAVGCNAVIFFRYNLVPVQCDPCHCPGERSQCSSVKYRLAAFGKVFST